MLRWLGSVLYRIRWSVLLLSIVLAIVMGWYGFGVFDALQGATVDNINSEAQRAQKLIDDNFTDHSHGETSNLLLLLSHAQLKATDADFAAAANQIIDSVKKHPEVISVSSYYSTHSSSFLSRDGHQTFIYIDVKTEEGEATVYHKLTQGLSSPTLHIDIGGALAISQQFNDQLKNDLAFSESLTLPIVVVLLIFIFGGLVAAAMPLLVGLFAIVGSLAILRLLTHVFTVSSYATNVVTIIGLGLAIDYSLFIVTRFREELAAHPEDVQGSVARTLATAGRTVLFSGLTVCTSLLGLLVFPGNSLKSVGIATICSALVAMFGAITVLPAVLSVIGRHIDAISFQRLLRRGKSQTEKGLRWYRLAQFVMHWSIPIIIVGVLFLLALGSPFLHVSLGSTDERSLPLGSSSRTVIEQLQKNFPNQDNSEIDIAIQTRSAFISDDHLTLLDSYVRKIQALPHVTNVASIVSLDPQLTLDQYKQIYAHPEAQPRLIAASQAFVHEDVTRVIVTADFDPHSQNTKDLVNKIRSFSQASQLSPLVGGDAAGQIDQLAALTGAIPHALPVMGVAIFLLLFLMTGSLIMPLKAMLLNVLSLSATFGAVVWIFQDGHFENILRFQAYGSLDIIELILIFAIAFGLSMDYEVFLLSRIKEQYDSVPDNREAVAVGLQRTGGLITSAALLLAVVVIAFATSRIIYIQEIGIGIALAIVMDATLVRGFLVPAMMRLLGDLNWWAPRPLKVLWSHIGLQEHLEDEETRSPDEEESVPIS